MKPGSARALTESWKKKLILVTSAFDVSEKGIQPMLVRTVSVVKSRLKEHAAQMENKIEKDR